MPADIFSPKNTKSHDFRTFYANAMGVQFSGSDMILRFAIMHNAADQNAGLEEQVAVAMTPSTAKALSFSLQTIIGQYESANNTVIPVSPETEAALKKAIIEAEKSAKK